MIDADHFHPELIWPYDPRLVPHPAPEVDVCAAPVVNVCMNVQWWAHVSGMISRLTYYDAWTGSEDEKHAAIESIYKILDVGRPTMSCGCGCGGGLPSRYNSDGVYQVSYDGGVTWVDAPDQDPRNNVTQLPPPTIGEGENGKCKAANSGVAFFKKEELDNLALIQAGAGIAEISAAIIAFIITLGLVAITGGAGIILVGGINAFLVGMIATEFEDAFTDAVWDKFLCALYCNMGDDLSFSDSQFQAVKSEMLTESNLIARTWFDKFLYVIGAKGLTNAVRIGALGTLSCDSCDCSTCADHFNVYFGTFVSRTPDSITVSGAFNPGDGKYHAQFGTDLPDGIKTGTICCYVSWANSALNDWAVWYCPDANNTYEGHSWDHETWFVDYVMPGPFSKTFTISDAPLPGPF